MSSVAKGLAMGEAQAATGISEAEFEALVESHQRRIYRLLLSMTRNPDTAETLTQDCFLRAYEKRNNFRGEASASTWITRIALNLAYDHSRSRRQSFWKRVMQSASGPAPGAAGGEAYEGASARAEVDMLPDTNAPLEKVLILREEVTAMWNAAGALPDQQKRVFMLRYVDEMSLEEIAQSTRLSLGTVKTHLRRATLTVRQSLRALRTGNLAQGGSNG